MNLEPEGAADTADAEGARTRARSQLGWRLALGLSAAFIAVRIAWMVLAPQRVLLNFEEGLRGLIAHEALLGLPLPLLEYRADNYSGGSLVVGLLATIPFALFGETLLSLKMVPLAFGLIAMLTWVAALREEGQPTAACVFAALMVASPPYALQQGTVAMGYHAETAAFTGASALGLVRALRSGLPPWHMFGLGALAGFALWFNYSFGVTLLAGASMVIRPLFRRDHRRALGLAVLGFLIGFSPWIAFNVTHRLAGLSLLKGPVWASFGLEHAVAAALDSLAFAPRILLHSFAWELGAQGPRRVVNVLYTLLLVMPWLALARADARRPLVQLSARTVLIFLVIIQFSELREARYMVPTFQHLYVLAALGVAALASRARAVAPLYVVAVMALAVGAHAALIPSRPSTSLLRQRGYTYGTLLGTLCTIRQEPGCLERGMSVLTRLQGSEWRELAGSVTLHLAAREALRLAPPSPAVLARLPRGFETFFFQRFGTEVMAVTRDLRRGRDLLDSLALPHDLAAAARRGLYSAWADHAAVGEAGLAVVRRRMDEGAGGEDYLRALGALTAFRADDVGQGLADRIRTLEMVAPNASRLMAEGAGAALAAGWLWRSGNDDAWQHEAERVRILPPSVQQGFWHGVGWDLAEFRGCASEETSLAELTKWLRPQERSAFDLGRQSNQTLGLCW
jgi:hypothetical protein